MLFRCALAFWTNSSFNDDYLNLGLPILSTTTNLLDECVTMNLFVLAEDTKCPRCARHILLFPNSVCQRCTEVLKYKEFPLLDNLS